ncbi:MAG: hypothetical protein IJW20_03550 [Clostridia bacterium]|nr:hypothetical protein [Clostridia bacterium]
MRSKKALKNIFLALMLQFITVICGFIVPRLIIENYGSDVNGLVSSITQFLAYITLLESGIAPVVRAQLYKPIAEKNNKQIADILKASEKFFKKIAYIFVGYLVVLCLAYPIIMNNQFDTLYTISLVIIISISTFAEYYFGMTYRIFLYAKQENYVVSLIQIITTIINTILVVVLVKMNVSIQIVKLISAIVFVFRPILQNIYVKRKYKIDIKEADNSYKLKQKWDGLAQHIAAVVHGNTDVAVLTFFSTMTEVSVYSIYLMVINGIKKIVNSLTGGIDASFGDMIARKENNNLNTKFRIYETFYITLITIVFSCTFVLIVPFVKVYTSEINDVNYIRSIFAFIIVLSEFIYAIRLPYNTLVLSAGHFKETRVGAWIEAGANLIISIILVKEHGLIGIAIGTLIAMLIRTIEFIVYSSKKILERNILVAIKKIIIASIEIILIFVINNQIFGGIFINENYYELFKYAIIIGCTACAETLIINYICFKKDFNEMIKTLKRAIKKEKRIENNVNT